MNLLYRQGNYGSLCFPYGKHADGGSCDFATPTCLEHCSEQYSAMSWFKDVLAFFESNNIITIYKKITEELNRNNFKLLYWFDCGDCPKRLTDKVLAIIDQLHNDGIIQLGFTRNKIFWKKVNMIDGIRFMLTVENKKNIKGEGFYALPDYDTAYTQIILNHPTHIEDDIIGFYCGGGVCYKTGKKVNKQFNVADCACDKSNTSEVVGGRFHSITSGDETKELGEANCLYCYQDKAGCFREI